MPCIEYRGVNILGDGWGMEPPQTFFTFNSIILIMRQRLCGQHAILRWPARPLASASASAFKYLWTVRLFVPKAAAISATVNPLVRNCFALVGSALVVPFCRPL